MKLKHALKDKIQKLTSSLIWQRIFYHRIDEEKMREYKAQHRLLALGIRIF